MASSHRRFARERHLGLKVIAASVSIAFFVTIWGAFAATFEPSSPAGSAAIAGAVAASATVPPAPTSGGAASSSPSAPLPSAMATPTPTVTTPASGSNSRQVAPVQRRSRGS